MARPDPGDPPAVRPQPAPGMIRQVREYRLITPLFGGGVEPFKADPITVVRASSIRGQLRFWWRATRGGRFDGDLAAMKAEEACLWGATSTSADPRPSRVEVVVEVAPDRVVPSDAEIDRPFEVVRGNPDRQGSLRARVRRREGTRVPLYAAFPLQPSDKEPGFEVGMRTKGVRCDVTFRLLLTYPAKKRHEVEAALWAWETFGGVGARTRRGFGTLVCEGGVLHCDGTTRELRVWRPRYGAVAESLERALAEVVVEGRWPDDVPHLSRSRESFRIVPGPPGGRREAVDAWWQLIDALSRFRQARPPAPRGGRPGRSFWPEPDSLRILVNRHAPNHRPQLRLGKYPRAAFGLPIVVHFKDRDDPADAIIQGGKVGDRGYDRLASPLILRPLLCGHGEAEVAVGLAIVLEGPRQPPGGLAVQYGGRLFAVNGEPLTAAEVGQLAVPLRGGERPDGTVDVLQAFLNYLGGDRPR